MPKDPGDLKLLLPLLLPFLLYPLGAWAVLRLLKGAVRTFAFGVYNVLAAFGLAVVTLVSPVGFDLEVVKRTVKVAGPLFAVYVLLVLLNYALLHRSKRGGDGAVLAAAYALPLLELIVIKYLPLVDRPFDATLRMLNVGHVSALFLGISYVTFRLSYLVQEVHNEVVEMPSVWDYLSFAFFVPTLSVGPINPYARFVSYKSPPNRERTPIVRSLLRIVVGLWKYLFVSNVLGKLTYAGLLLDGHPHGILDLVVAIFSYSVFLYCNFSGLCDMVIGVSGLLGIEVMENFDRPFVARNFQEFWSRWHISLSSWLRDMMFTPLVKILVRAWGPKKANHAIAAAIMAVFVTIGVWHGASLNFLLFGISQGLGVAVVHYSTIFMKKRLGKQAFAAYRSNRFYYGLGCAATYVYFSLTLFLFANTIGDMKAIARALM